MQDTPLIILVAFLWLTSVRPCLFSSPCPVSLECQDQTWHSRCLSSVLSTETRTSSPHLLAMHFLMQCRLVLSVFATGTHRLMVSCLSTPTPGPSFRAASLPVIAQPVQVPGVTSPLMQDLAFPFAEFHNISVSPFLHLSRSHCMAAHSAGLLSTLPSFVFFVVH